MSTTTHEIIAIAAQKRIAQATVSTRRNSASMRGIGPAHIRAALIYTARKVN